MSPTFDISDNTAYELWRERKLQHAPTNDLVINSFFLSIPDCNSIDQKVANKIVSACKQNSFCLYRVTDTDNNKVSITQLAKQVGMLNPDANICADSDKLTSITRTSHQGQHEYIPYSNNRLSWHTDGYYNTPDRRINSMLLHCKQPAKTGGESLLMDHEIAYILLRDKNPDLISALMEKDAMTIPANILDGKVIREAQTGPIFSILDNGQLHMRYSARKRNIEWKQTDLILEAVDFLENLFNSGSPYILKYTLQEGEGLICRNILHRRTSFVDYDEHDKKRLLYRGRYLDSISTN